MAAWRAGRPRPCPVGGCRRRALWRGAGTGMMRCCYCYPILGASQIRPPLPVLLCRGRFFSVHAFSRRNLLVYSTGVLTNKSIYFDAALGAWEEKINLKVTVTDAPGRNLEHYGASRKAKGCPGISCIDRTTTACSMCKNQTVRASTSTPLKLSLGFPIKKKKTVVRMVRP